MALVLTYDLEIEVRERATHRNVDRRVKRDNFCILVSELDLEGDPLEPTNRIDFDKLAHGVASKCPLLQQALDSERVKHQDIKLHLVYLANRKRQTASAAAHASAPASSTRSRSGTSRAASRSGSVLGQDNRRATSYAGDVSSRQHYVTARLQTSEELVMSNLSDLYAYLNAGEVELQLLTDARELRDTHIDPLYNTAPSEELAASLELISSLASDKRNLVHMAANRLLINGLLRILRALANARQNHATADRKHLQTLLVICRILVSPEATGVLLRSSEGNSTSQITNMFEVCIALLHYCAGCEINDIANAQGAATATQALVTNSILALNLTLFSKTNNLDDCESTAYGHVQASLRNEFSRNQRPQTSGGLHKPPTLACSMTKLFVSVTRQCLSATKEEQLLLHLKQAMYCVRMWLSLSQYRDFIANLDLDAEFCASLDKLVCWSQDLQANSPSERMYLEIELWRLVHNVCLDDRTRAILIDRCSPLTAKLMQHLMRAYSLLATSATTEQQALVSPTTQVAPSSLADADKSAALICVLRCLYWIVAETEHIQRHMVAIQRWIDCLMAYLISAALCLRDELSIKRAARGYNESTEGSSFRADNDLEVVHIAAHQSRASHYITALWMQLCDVMESNDDRLAAQLNIFIELSRDNLALCAEQIEHSQTPENDDEFDTFSVQLITGYMHAKVLRCILNKTSARLIESIGEWLIADVAIVTEQFAVTTCRLRAIPVAFCVECTGILTQLVEHSSDNANDESTMNTKPDWGKLLDSLLGLLRLREYNDDDLLLAFSNLVATLARRREVCPWIVGQIPDSEDRKEVHCEARLVGPMLSMFAHVLETRQSNIDLIIAMVFAFAQLTNHREFVRDIADCLSYDTASSNVDSGAPKAIRRCIKQLVALMLHSEARLAKLATLLVDRLRQIETEMCALDLVQDDEVNLRDVVNESESVYSLRFAGYNATWTNAINAARSINDNDKELDVYDKSHGEEMFSNDDEDDDYDWRQLMTGGDSELDATHSSRSTTPKQSA